MQVCTVGEGRREWPQVNLAGSGNTLEPKQGFPGITPKERQIEGRLQPPHLQVDSQAHVALRCLKSSWKRKEMWWVRRARASSCRGQQQPWQIWPRCVSHSLGTQELVQGSRTPHIRGNCERRTHGHLYSDTDTLASLLTTSMYVSWGATLRRKGDALP